MNCSYVPTALWYNHGVDLLGLFSGDILPTEAFRVKPSHELLSNMVTSYVWFYFIWGVDHTETKKVIIIAY